MKAKPIIAIVFVAALFLLGCHKKGVPEKFLGVWETTSPRYKNCTLEFEEERVIFRNGLHHLNINYISFVVTGVEQSDTNKMLYHIHYKDVRGQEYKLSLYYIKTPKRGVIRFMHQEGMPWLKREG